jgi:hypothetical protein
MFSKRKSVNLPPRVWEVRKQARKKLGQDSQGLGRRITGKGRKYLGSITFILCMVKQGRETSMV